MLSFSNHFMPVSSSKCTKAALNVKKLENDQFLQYFCHSEEIVSQKIQISLYKTCCGPRFII